MTRTDGYAPIRDYAAIGDGRTVALVARDGTIDWLPFPTSRRRPRSARCSTRDGQTLPPRAGREVRRRAALRPGTNVLETTFRTATGAVRMTDAITTQGARHAAVVRARPPRRRGCPARLRLRWELDLRFPIGGGERTNVELLTSAVSKRTTRARSSSARGTSAMLALVAVEDEPLAAPDARRDRAPARRDDGRLAHVGPRSRLRRAVARRGHAVGARAEAAHLRARGRDRGRGDDLFAGTTRRGTRTGTTASAGCATAAYTLDALLALGRREDAHASLSWLLDRIATTAPEIKPLYALAGGPPVDERTVPLEGYRGSKPVRVGNAAGRPEAGIRRPATPRRAVSGSTRATRSTDVERVAFVDVAPRGVEQGAVDTELVWPAAVCDAHGLRAAVSLERNCSPSTGGPPASA